MLTLSGSGGEAQAAEPAGAKRVLLVKTQRQDDVGGMVTTRVDRAVGTALAVDSRIELVLPEGLAVEAPAAVTAAPVTDETLLKADKAVDEAKTLFSKEKYMEAVKVFSKAMGLYEKKLALLEDFDRYVDAQLGRALAYFLAGYDDNGEDELGRVLALRPTLVLDKRKVPKGASDALERLHMLYARAMAEPVTVEAGVSAALVYVDGVSAGAAPAKLDKLYRGRHWVRVVAEGYEPWADSVEAGGAPLTVKAKLKALKRATGAVVAVAALTPEELTEAARTGAFGKRFDQGAAATCAKHGLAGIFMTYVRPSPDGYEFAGFYFDAEGGKLAQVDSVRIDAELADLQVNVLTLGERLVSAAANFPGGPSLAGTPKVYERQPKGLSPAELAAAKAEAQRAEKARLEAERLEAERVAAEQAAAARAEAERAAAKAEAERTVAERAAAKRLEAERAVADKAEAKRLAAEAKRLAAERAAEARADAKRSEAERVAAAKAAAEREAAERAASRGESARLEAERAEKARIAAEMAEAARIASARAAAAQRAAEAAQLEADRAEAARIAAERDAGQGADERSAAARAEAARRAEAERAARAEADRAEVTRRSEAERAARAEADRAEAARRSEAERAARAEADRAEAARRAEAGRSLLERQREGHDVVVGPPRRVVPPVVEDDDEFYESWWFWTLVTGALVGGGAATYFALSDNGGGTPSGFRTTVTF